MTRLNRFLHAFGPLAPVAGFILAGLAVFSISRLGLFALYAERLTEVENFWWVFPIGVRMDIIMISMVIFIPTFFLLLLPERGGRWWKPLFALWFTVWLSAFVYMEVATFPFIAEYDNRPNRLFVEYLMYPKEVVGMLLADYKLALLAGFGLLAISARLGWRLFRHLLAEHAPWGYWQRLLLLPLIMVLIFAGARSSLGHRAANASTAAFSNDNLANELGLNSTYSLANAIYRMGDESNSARLYGEMEWDEVIERVRRHSLISSDRFVDPERPTLHRQLPSTPRERPYNLVIFLQESLGAESVGSLGGKPLTPNLDRLSHEGLYLRRLYATGTRTVRGIEAVLTGFLPTAGRSVVKLGLAQTGFFTMADLLRRHGYATQFIYGGEGHFDNMAKFLLGNGFDRVIDERDFEEAVFKGVWGASDEDLVRRAHQEFVAHGDKPFFALMLSTSNHIPFDFPEGRIELYEEPAATVNNAIKYADYAIGEFFRLARTADYYENTIFVVVADHSSRVFGADLVPVEQFHIPGLIIGPGVPAVHYDRVASQIDIMPTVLGLLGIEVEHPMLGRDLLSLPEDDPGHAFMQYYQTNAFRVGEQVVIHQPNRAALQFTLREGRLEPVDIDPELVRDALAHIYLPVGLYSERRYGLAGGR